MKRAVQLLAAAAALAAAPSLARDYGQQGAVFAVAEPDLLRTIQQKLARLEQSGAIAQLNQEFARRSEARVRRPAPLPGIERALRPRTWVHDPAITIDHDIRDNRGNLLARAGQRINPLSFISLRQSLVFIDGDVPAQVEWALTRYSEANAKLIMVKGAPLEAMTRHQRRFYFDQGGYLVQRFGIRAVPAIAEQAGQSLRVSEIPLQSARP